jgi:hypothetical protein
MLGAVLAGDLRRMLEAEAEAGKRAAMTAMRAETDAAKEELRAQVRAAFGAKGLGVANAWRLRVLPSSGQSLRPAALVFTKVPTIVDAFDRGATIRPKGGGKCCRRRRRTTPRPSSSSNTASTPTAD